MSEGRREALVDAGRHAMSAFFDNPPTERALCRGPQATDATSVGHIADRIATSLLAW